MPPEPTPKPSFFQAWDRFFFTPADPRPLAAVRILVGSLLVWNWIWTGVDLGATLGPAGWANPTVVPHFLPAGAWSIWFWIPEAWLWASWCLGLAGFLALTLGSFTRVSAIIAWVFVVSTIRRAPVLLFGFDNIVAIWSFYLAITGAGGQAFSIDCWLQARRGLRPAAQTVSANLGLRLIQLHLCLIYASAGLAKLQGVPWWDGSAVGMLLGNSEFRPFDLGYLAEHAWLIELATHVTLAFELLYPILIWQPWFRPWLLALAVLLHCGIALAMGLTEFSLAMLAGNLAFVPSRWFTWLPDRLSRRTALAGIELPKSNSSKPRPRRRP